MIKNFKTAETVYVIYPFGTGGNHITNLLSLHETFYEKFYNTDYYQYLYDEYQKKLNLEPDVDFFLELNKLLLFAQNDIKELRRNGITDVKTEVERLLKNFDKGFLRDRMFGSLSLMYNAHIWQGHPSKTANETTYEDSVEIVYWQGKTKIHANIPINDYNTSLSRKLISQGHTIEEAIVEKCPQNKILKKLWHNLKFEMNLAGVVVTQPIKETSRAYKRLLIANKDFKKVNSIQYKIPFQSKNTVIFNHDNSVLIDSDLFCENDGSYYFQEIIKDKFDILLPNKIHELHQVWVQIIDKSIALAENKY